MGKKKLIALLIAIILSINFYGVSYAETDNHEYTQIFINASDEDFKALEQVVYNEAGHCKDWRVRLAVIETVCNRVLDPDFPDTIYEVCHQRNQFACRPFKTDEYTFEAVCDAIEEVYHSGRTVLPSTRYVYFATFKNIGKNYLFIGSHRLWQGMWFAEK